MNYKQAFDRAVATFIFGVSSAPVPAVIFDVDAWKFAAAAGVAAVWNLVVRYAQAYLNTFPEEI
jgi:hypothetical protein